MKLLKNYTPLYIYFYLSDFDYSSISLFFNSGDRVLEINGVNLEQYNRKQVSENTMNIFLIQTEFTNHNAQTYCKTKIKLVEIFHAQK